LANKGNHFFGFDSFRSIDCGQEPWAVQGQQPHVGLRLVLGLATAIAVSGTAYLTAWQSLRGYDLLRHGQFATRRDLEVLRSGIERHGNATGSLPARLADLDEVKTEGVRVDDAGEVVDYWLHPYQYRVEGDNYTLFSYGRDGQLGGTGLDTDLYAGEEHHPGECLTLWQFTTAWGVGGIQVTCILAGLVAFPLCFLQGRERQGARPSLAEIVVANAVTLFFCLLTALPFASFTFPPGTEPWPFVTSATRCFCSA
jgi:hypothetical protein